MHPHDTSRCRSTSLGFEVRQEEITCYELNRYPCEYCLSPTEQTGIAGSVSVCPSVLCRRKPATSFYAEPPPSPGCRA
jgi:hypothetical protein